MMENLFLLLGYALAFSTLLLVGCFISELIDRYQEMKRWRRFAAFVHELEHTDFLNERVNDESD
jgi:hypothetical protein